MDLCDGGPAEQQGDGSKIWQRRVGILLIVFGCVSLAGKWAIDRMAAQTQELITPESVARTIEGLEIEHNIFAVLGSAIAGGIWLVADSLSFMRQRTRAKLALGVCLAICVITVWIVVRESNRDSILVYQRWIIELESGSGPAFKKPSDLTAHGFTKGFHACGRFQIQDHASVPPERAAAPPLLAQGDLTISFHCAF